MKCRAFERLLKAAIGATAAFVVLWPFDAALADCTPASGSDVVATCTGTTIDQGAGAPGTSAGAAGYGSGAETNLTVTVGQSASVTGTGSPGIILDSGTVTNFGTITGSSGVRGFTSVNLFNSGTLIGNGGDAAGITVLGGTATVNNTGSIIAIGGNTASGITADVANVSNWGTITAVTTNLGAVGISANTVNLSNWGTITAAGGNNNFGVNGLTVNVFNCGTISGSSAGISAASQANVTNCGTISGRSALSFASNADTLTLLPGSKLIGAINLGGGGDTVNFRAGNQNLTFDTLVGATITSTVPFVVSGNQVATIDPTPFVANGRALGDFTRSASQVVPDLGNQPAATSGGPIGYAPSAPSSVVSSAFDGMPGLQAYAADQAVFKAPTVVQADGTAIWARGFGGYRTQNADGMLLRTSSTFYGGAIGFEKQVRYDLRVGAFAGGGTTRSTIELNTGDTNSNLGFGGVYARYFRGASFLYVAVQGGGSQNDTTRNINNNLVASGLETAKGSYSGWYISPELRLGHNIALGRVMDSQYTLTPSIGVRYLYGSFGGYTETGSTANLTMNSQTVGTLEERAELKLTRITQFNATTALLIDVTGGALGTQRVGSNTVNAALLGQSIPFAVPGKDDVFGGFAGGGMEWRTGAVALFASGEYLWLSDSSTVISGKGGVRVAF